VDRARNDRALREPASLQVASSRRRAFEKERALRSRPRNGSSSTVPDRGEGAAAFRRAVAAHPTEAEAGAPLLTYTPAASHEAPGPGCLSRTCTACMRCHSATAPTRWSHRRCPRLIGLKLLEVLRGAGQHEHARSRRHCRATCQEKTDRDRQSIRRAVTGFSGAPAPTVPDSSEPVGSSLRRSGSNTSQ
jgi:cytochrome c553